MWKYWKTKTKTGIHEIPLRSWNSMQQEIVRWIFCPRIATNRSMNDSSKNCINCVRYKQNVTMAEKKLFQVTLHPSFLHGPDTARSLDHSKAETLLAQCSPGHFIWVVIWVMRSAEDESLTAPGTHTHTRCQQPAVLLTAPSSATLPSPSIDQFPLVTLPSYCRQ